MQNIHCTELLLLSPQRVVEDVRELTTFRYHLTLLCRVRLPQGPRLPYMRTIVTFLRFDTTLAGERSFFATMGSFLPWGPTGGHLLTNQVAQWFTNTCLLALLHFHQHLLAGLAASSPALACWTFLHLKVRNWTVYFNCLRFLGLFSSIIPFPMQ